MLQGTIGMVQSQGEEERGSHSKNDTFLVSMWGNQSGTPFDYQDET